jgi:hypothetical protein
MKTLESATATDPGSSADRKILVDGLTLMALGLSVLFLNSWDSLFVRTSVGLFWGTFFVILNWSSLVQAYRGLRQNNDRQRHRSYESASPWR